MKEFEAGCQRPKAQAKPALETAATPVVQKGEQKTMIRVGKPAPEFIAPGFHRGKFVEMNLADYRGKWVMLCIYPGDFTFV